MKPPGVLIDRKDRLVVGYATRLDDLRDLVIHQIGLVVDIGNQDQNCFCFSDELRMYAAYACMVYGMYKSLL